MAGSRIRTIFQSLDTARYQKDGSDERMFDTAHARSEALSALLFGHEIIIPAGVIADCPAFVELFGEIMGPSDDYRIKMREDDEMYRPFRIALERRFDTTTGLSGYDAFIDNYHRNFTIEAADSVDLVSIGDLDNGSQRAIQQQKRVAFLVDAFLNKKWKEVRAVSENYADHIQRVYAEFSPRATFPAKPAWAAADLLSTLSNDYYRQRIEMLCGELENRDVPLEGIAKLRSTTATVYERLPNPALRGQWYKNGPAFEDQWPIIRTWLDQGLYRLITASYEIALPSLFLQETDDDEIVAEAALAFLPPANVEKFTAQARTGKLPLPPVPEGVNWRDIWEMISEPDFRQSTGKLQFELADAYQNERARRFEARAKHAQDRAALERELGMIAGDRARRVTAAIAAHVEMMNNGQTKLKFERGDNGRLTVSTQKHGKAGPAARSTTLALLGTGGSMLVDASGLFTIGVPASAGLGFAIKFGMKLGDRLTGGAIDRVIEQSTDWAVDKVGRRILVQNTDRQQMESIEQSRVNLWITPQ
jgi:hypothetical protein